MTRDGHPSYLPDGSMVVTDTYSDKARLVTIYLIKHDKSQRLPRVFVPFKYDNDVRCDLRSRWNRKEDRICFDGVFEGKRGLYVVKVTE